MREFPQTLLDPTLYEHAVEYLKMIETHLSWVILTGQFVYKIKKPLNLGFQDYTTLEKRKKYCELELNLNKRTARDLYLKVIPIFGTPQNPQFKNANSIFEYAVVMNEFPQQALLSNIAHQKQLHTKTILQLSEAIARFHQQIDSCDPAHPYGTPEYVIQPIWDNFTQLKECTDPTIIAMVDALEAWNKSAYSKLKPLLQYRKKAGYIKACHGDLHLGNIALIKDYPIIFDCIEFNESFRWIDVLNDLAFICMDFDYFSLPQFSSLLLNFYLEQTLDYNHLALLGFYQCYRAVVRAKITYLQLKQHPLTTELQNKFSKLLSLACTYIRPQLPTLTLTHGLSGSGKTLYTQTLLTDSNTIRLRSDIFRLRKISSASSSERYSETMTTLVYTELEQTTSLLLQAGFHVIVDATFLKAKQRELFYEIAKKLNRDVQVLNFEASYENLKQRIHQRMLQKHDLSEADLEVLNMQVDQLEPLTEIEKKWTKTIDERTIDQLIETMRHT